MTLIAFFKTNFRTLCYTTNEFFFFLNRDYVLEDIDKKLIIFFKKV